jgi:hypothetical protein
MDPVCAIGLAASALQLADSAGSVLIKLYRYWVDVKEAGSKAERLREELGFTLSQVSAISELLNPNINPTVTKIDTSRLPNALQNFRKVVEYMEKRAQPGPVSGLERLKWPFKKAENDDLLAQIERCKSAFSLAINIDER